MLNGASSVEVDRHLVEPRNRPMPPNASPDDDTIAEFKSRLNRWLLEFCEAKGLEPSVYTGRNEVWQIADVEPFLRAAELFDSSGAGVFRWPRTHSEITLFWAGNRSSSPRPAFLARETLVTMGAVAELHEQLNWPTELIEVETKGYTFDFAAYETTADGAERMVIAGEAKALARDLDKWQVALDGCMAMAPHDADAHKTESQAQVRLNAHKKRVGLDLYRPDYLWLVALGTRRSFRVLRGSLGPLLEPAGLTPPPFEASVDAATGD